MREETYPTAVETRYDQRPALRSAPAAASSLKCTDKIVILGRNQAGLPLRPAEDLPQHWSERSGGGCTSLVVRVHLVAPIIVAPIGVRRRSGAPKGFEVQRSRGVAPTHELG